MKKTVFLKNAAILTAVSLIIRFLGIVFKIWLSRAIGAEGMGLYQLIFSVYMLFSTFTSAGISTATTRLIADELALGGKNGAAMILRRCMLLTLLLAAASSASLLLGSDFISSRLLGDIRAAAAIKSISLIMPFMGISSVLRGYFIARRQAAPPAVAQLLEQLIRIAAVFLLLKKYSSQGISAACTSVIIADASAHFIAATLLALLYLHDIASLGCKCEKAAPTTGIFKAIIHISLPITAGRYLNTGLRTVESMLVPRGLEKSAAGNSALSQFGMIRGMALPVLFFPSTLLNAVSTMLIPEISEAAACGRKGLVKSAAERIIQLTALVSFLFSAIFLTSGKQIGSLLFKSNEVGYLLCALSPIVPLMYLDSVCDGILKGLDQQRFGFFTGLLDSGSRILLVLLILPRCGMNGFLGIMYFSNFLTCIMNVGRLVKVSKAQLNITGWLLLPISAALIIALTANRLLIIFKLPELIYIALICAVSFPLYTAALFSLGSLSADNIRDVIPRRKKSKGLHSKLM